MTPEPGSFLARVRVPHVFPLLLGVIFVCALLTWVLPSGTYDRVERRFEGMTRQVVVPGTYRELPKEVSLSGVLAAPDDETPRPTGIVGFLTAVPRGMEASADIIFLIFIVGGVFGILQRTGTITAVIHALLARFAATGRLLPVILMTVVAIGGSTLGMGEELIPLVPIFLLVSKEMGGDRIFGVALVYLSAAVGFAAATTNPFTVQIAQGIAGVPLGSGLGFRLIFFVSALALTCIYVLRYGARVRRDPSQSLLADNSDTAPEAPLPEAQRLDRAHLAIVLFAAVIFALTLYAIQTRGWWLAELSGGFLLIGLVAAALGRLPVAEATSAFVRGLEEMVVAALVVGFARGIQVVLEDARVLDTIIHAAAQVLQHVPAIVAAQGMLLFQTVLNFFIPSGSGQAAVTMPLMAPLADVLGLTRQTAVFAFTCGDGFSNTIIPTSGVLMAMLGLARVPYERWLRFMLPLFLQLLLLSAVFLSIAVYIEL